MSRRWKLRLIAILPICVITLPVLGVWIYQLLEKEWIRSRGEREFREAIADLDRKLPGWRWDDLQLEIQPVAPEKNILTPMRQIFPLIDSKVALRTGSEIILSDDIPRNQLDDVEEIAELRTNLENYSKAIQLARTLKNFERRGMRTALPKELDFYSPQYSQKAREVVSLLRYDLRLNVNLDRIDLALADLESMLAVTGSLIDEPHLSSHLCRCATLSMSCYSLEQLLGTSPAPIELTEISKRLDALRDPTQLRRSIRGELALTVPSFELLITRSDLQSDLIEAASGSSREDREYELHLPGDLATVIRELAAILQRQDSPLRDQVRTLQKVISELSPKEFRSISRYHLLAMQKTLEVAQRTLGILECTRLGLAAERYYRKYQKWPNTIQALAPEFIDAIPEDPDTGELISMKRCYNGLYFYTDHPNPRSFDYDWFHSLPADDQFVVKHYGFRLWDHEHRRLPPPPPKPELLPDPDLINEKGVRIPWPYFDE